MEAFALYLFKSSVWLAGFAAVYFLFLRNERFFVLNRIFLVAGIVFSVVFPFFTWHYTVIFPIMPTVNVDEPQVQAIGMVKESFQTKDLLLYIYILGALYLIYRLIKQTISVWQLIRKSETLHFNSVKLIRSDRYPASFSFFSFVFVNPSTHEHEINEIVNHEQEHIRQLHWIDLLLFEILCTIQWFNPIVWIYGRFIRQNHEFLADEYAIKRSPNPAIYRAALLNQMFGVPVISLANSFNYSINKKRFNMMKQITYSPFRKLKLLLVLPLIAGVFYAFAAPEYKFVQANPEQKDNLSQSQTENKTNPTNFSQEKVVKGTVINEQGKPLRGTSIIISGTTIGTMPDENGNFELKAVDDSPIVFSFVGFQTQKVKPNFEKEMVITMKRAVIGIEEVGNKPSDSEIFRTSGPVLTFVDGKEISEEDFKKIKPDQIERISVLRKKEFTDKYGEKGKNGVVLITLKKSPAVEFSAKEVEAKNEGDVTIKEPQTLNIKSKDGKQPLLVIDGVISKDKKVEDIDPNTIQSMSVWKDEQAIEKYGEKGKEGVIEIATKSALQNNQPLYILDGKVLDRAPSFDDLSPKNIASVEVLKNESATALYGEKGKNGVIVITSKNKNSAVTIRSNGNDKNPLIVIDGVISAKKMDDIKPETIESINVLKGDMAIKKYGENGK
ncbi:MAG TPA: TonB-dependent receptor plug domain-containing protein, partial [Prolixibacteraceae bacterium]|nr:TonB-dependent receptor plug domain-containing protein [Prolixibacteraceae bacterium]